MTAKKSEDKRLRWYDIAMLALAAFVVIAVLGIVLIRPTSIDLGSRWYCIDSLGADGNYTACEEWVEDVRPTATECAAGLLVIHMRGEMRSYTRFEDCMDTYAVLP